MTSFDELASQYDQWFMNNHNVLDSEVRLVAHFMNGCGEALSVGCGSGLFESILKRDFGIEIANGIEPSTGMADIARQRGMDVTLGTAEDAELGEDRWDTILFNGTPSYITDLTRAFRNAYRGLRSNGRIVVLDVPKESSFGTVYNLALTLGTWDHPLLDGVQPPDPYPIEFVKAANWRTTAEKIELLEQAGFTNLEFAQTLTGHPVYADDTAEEPIPGYTRGDYVAIRAYKGRVSNDE